MKKYFIAAMILAAVALLAMPASATQYDSMTMDTSQSYLRLGFDDTITVTVRLMDHGSPARTADVPILVSFMVGGDYVQVVDKETKLPKPMVVTNSNGEASACIMLNPDNLPERVKLPLLVWIEASVIGKKDVHAFSTIYITETGPILGYVLDDTGSTITGAEITVITQDGKVFPGGPFRSNEEPPMGYYRIDNLPIMPSGRDTLIATKNGFTGTRQAEPGSESIRYDITIGGYRDSIDISDIVTGIMNATATPAPATPAAPETPAKPTTKTTTILIAIALITVVYVGLKTYRRMF